MSAHGPVRADAAQIIAVDFETTGTVGKYPDEPWQLGMATLKDGCVRPHPRFTSLLRVGDRPFNPQCPGRHEELREEIASAPRLSDLWPDLQQWWLPYPLAAHNVATEKRLIRQMAPLHRFGPWIDTLKLARVAYPNLKSHQLEDLLAQLNLVNRVTDLCPDLQPHDALFDAYACGVVLEHLLQLNGWQGATIQTLAKAHPKRYHRRIAERTPRRPPRR